MKSFAPAYLEKVVIPQRLITTIRLLGEYKGKQKLYQQQAPEMLENLRQVAMIQSNGSRVENMIEEICFTPDWLDQRRRQLKTDPGLLERALHAFAKKKELNHETESDKRRLRVLRQGIHQGRYGETSDEVPD